MPPRQSTPYSSLATRRSYQAWMSPVMRWTAEPLFGESLIARPVQARRAEGADEKTRRVLNVAVAAVSLFFVWPLLLLIAIAVKLSSPGPVFFIQERVGLDQRRSRRGRRANRRSTGDRRGPDAGGRVFKMYKFRTMYVNQGHHEQVWAEKNDPRITPVGRVLRALRFDELPQLWNVLRGDMNVVGPRPEQPEIFQHLRSEISNYQRRQQVLPGITGWAQIKNGYDQSFKDVERKVSYDLEYLERRSAAEDLKIMALTVPVVLGRKVFM